MLVDTVMKVEAAQSVYGSPILTATQSDSTARAADGYKWLSAYRLKFDGPTSKYPATGRVVFPAVVSLNLKSFPKIRLTFFDSTRPDPDGEASDYAGTTIQARVHNGTASFYWNGSTWAPVTDDDANWNTPTEVETNAYPALIATTGFGLEFKLNTTDLTKTPKLYGASSLWRLDLSSRSGAYKLADSWTDDAVHRTLIPWLTSLTFHRSFEAVIAAGVLEIPLSSLDGYTVSSVTSAYWLDTDPYRRGTAETGTYNSSTNVFTLSANAKSSPTRIHLDLECTVGVVSSPHEDLVTAKVPVVVLTTLDKEVTKNVGKTGVKDNSVVMEIPAPQCVNLGLSLRIDAPDPKDCWSVWEKIESQFKAGKSISLVSEGTARPVYVAVPRDDVFQSPQGGGVLSSLTATMALRYHTWYAGTAVQKALVAEATQVGDGIPVSAITFEVAALDVPVSV